MSELANRKRKKRQRPCPAACFFFLLLKLTAKGLRLHRNFSRFATAQASKGFLLDVEV